MKINEKQLEDYLLNLYKYHMQRYFALHKDYAVHNWEPDYELGQHDGAVSAVGAIMLLCFGGEKTFNLWQAAREQIEEEPDER